MADTYAPARGSGGYPPGTDGWTRFFVWMGIIGGFASGIVMGPLAVRSLTKWRTGVSPYATFAVFWGVVSTAALIIAAAAAVLHLRKRQRRRSLLPAARSRD